MNFVRVCVKGRIHYPLAQQSIKEWSANFSTLHIERGGQ
jgi:hypothetical protein